MNESRGKDYLIQELKDIISEQEAQARDDQERIRTLTAENEALRRQAQQLQKQTAVKSDPALLRQIADLQYCLDETRKSFSYRLGYKLTAPVRRLRRS